MREFATRLAARIAYPGGTGGRMNVLAFHRVLREPDPLNPTLPDIRAFRELVGALSRTFQILPLSEAVTRLDAGTLPPRSIAITFDDGYKDNVENAAPVLAEFGACATVFIATGYLSRTMMWNDCILEGVRQWSGHALDLGAFGLGVLPTATAEDRLACVTAIIDSLKYSGPGERDSLTSRLGEQVGFEPERGLMLTPDDVRALPDGTIEVGAHTVTHPILRQQSAEEARREIADSKSTLEELTGRPVTLFAYPNGKPGYDYSLEHAEMVREVGFTAAFSTMPGVVTRAGDRFQLPRFTPWDQAPARFLVKLLVHGLRPGSVS